MATHPPLTVTGVMAEASAALEAAGYREADPGRVKGWSTGAARIYEDPYSIAALVVFETWADLSGSWLVAQDALVELISDYFSRGDPKAWEGYLVLLTPSVLPTDGQLEETRIRRDTTHVRKLVATAEDLSEPGGIERALLPLIPLAGNQASVEERSPFALLPEILGRRGISEEAVLATVEAFETQEPIAERLHALVTSEEEIRPE